MNLYSGLVFFICCSALILLCWTVLRVRQKWSPYLFLIVSLAVLVIDINPFHKLPLWIIFYLLIIWLAKKTESKVSLLLWILLSVFPLVVFKLSDFNLFPGKIERAVSFIGISYITFRVIQILVDLESRPPRNFFNIVTFLINPLTLLAGPIDRFYRFEENLENHSKYLTKDLFVKGWYFFCVGVLQKFVLGFFWDQYITPSFDTQSTSFYNIIGTSYSFSVSLYFDFAGYSLMAVGLSYMMGIALPLNFDKPWLTANPQDLWRRFHITLGSFLNDYFFKPIYMFLARKSFFKVRRLFAQNVALLATFLLMGAWNGLKWHYILSGFMFGLSSVIYNVYTSKWKKQPTHIVHCIPIPLYRFFFLNYIVWALYFFSGKLPI